MSDTPRTDAAAFVAGNFRGKHDVVTVEFAEQLERELNAAKSALSGRTVSCSNCNELARENAEMLAAIATSCEALNIAKQYILSLPYFGNSEELEANEKIASAIAKLNPCLK